MIERVTDEKGALAQLRSSKKAGVGSTLQLPGQATAIVAAQTGSFFQLHFSEPVLAYLDKYGETPLPPYLGRDALEDDVERYQTVYAKHPGAVAAPTAGLHFDKRLLAETLQLGARHAFVTLHVGAGTFQNLRQDAITANRLHAERVSVGADACAAVRQTRTAGGRVIAIGTTSVRALEAASQEGSIKPFAGETDLFILPGYRFRSVDALLTNFHLPRSSLLMLVAAFAGKDLVMQAYRHAIAERYRFFSYGDAMFVLSRRSLQREV
jgi:S-adenosylmethionine:tRNA ribosyltransferase-isomerase